MYTSVQDNLTYLQGPLYSNFTVSNWSRSYNTAILLSLYIFCRKDCTNNVQVCICNFIITIELKKFIEELAIKNNLNKCNNMGEHYEIYCDVTHTYLRTSLMLARALTHTHNCFVWLSVLLFTYCPFTGPDDGNTYCRNVNENRVKLCQHLTYWPILALSLIHI